MATYLLNALHIDLPDGSLPEKTYLVRVILEDFLGLVCNVGRSDSAYYELYEPLNSKKLQLRDAFFYGAPEGGRQSSENIPQVQRWAAHSFVVGLPLPVLYGTDRITTNETGTICEIDVFAAIFFMLTRWEEQFIEKPDKYQRFSAEASLAWRWDFLHRPIVEEYLLFLKNMLRHILPGIVFRPTEFKVQFTHDIDFWSAPVRLRNFAKDILVRRSFSAFSKRWAYWRNRVNPIDLFDLFMDVSERHGGQAHFYCIAGHRAGKLDGEKYYNHPQYRATLRRVIARGHVVGLHPSVQTLDNPTYLIEEKERLESIIGAPVTTGRQHLLRFKLPDTWEYWEQAGLTCDSTLGYAGAPGFRCGTGRTFPVFSVRQRRVLNLREMPLIVMDTTLKNYLGLYPNAGFARMAQFIETGRQYQMPITLLLHNSLGDDIEWPGWKKVYLQKYSG